MIKVLFFGTHPKQYNGYSKVVYELMKCMKNRKDIEFNVFGFQNFYENPKHRSDIPSDMYVYDAFSNENPKGVGFGVEQVKDVVKKIKPDVCIVYNDMMIIHQVVTQLKNVQKDDNMNFKIIAYIDQVYLHQKKEFIEFINNNADLGLLFTKHWEDIIKEQGLKLPTSYLQHGFNKMTYYPIPKTLARQYYGLKPEDFIILNLNRNQPRKRWDICLKAFAEIVSRYPNEPIKLMIATAVQGAWNLIEIYERELKKRNMTLQDGMKHIILIDNPQRITDEETNILYNVADIGINTCDGEGFGLCNFEQGAIGIPQIVPRLGGFMDFFDDDTAILCDPKMAYYVDNTRDAVCGEALLCEYMDFVEGIESYYFNKELMKKHGQTCRKNIITNYNWEAITEKLCDIVKKVVGIELQEPSTSTEIKSLQDEVEKIDIASMSKIFNSKSKDNEEKPSVPDVVVTNVDKEPVSKTTKKSKKDIQKKQILKLKKKLDRMLNDYSVDT